MLPSFSFGAEGVEYGRNSAFYAPADGVAGGVTQLLAGSNVTLTPSNGLGVVTVSATAGAGGVSSVTTTGSGISATPNTGAVVLANTGVTSLVAGSGVSVSGASGDVTVSNSGVTSLVAGTGISLSGSSGAVTVSAVPGPYTVGSLTVTGVLTAQNQVFFSNTSGTYDSPLQLPASPTITSLPGTSGFIQIPFISVQPDGRWYFASQVTSQQAYNSMIICTPTGETQNRFSDSTRLEDAVVNVKPRGMQEAPFNTVFRLEGYATPSSPSTDPTLKRMEAYFCVINLGVAP